MNPEYIAKRYWIDVSHTPINQLQHEQELVCNNGRAYLPLEVYSA